MGDVGGLERWVGQVNTGPPCGRVHRTIEARGWARIDRLEGEGWRGALNYSRLCRDIHVEKGVVGECGACGGGALGS